MTTEIHAVFLCCECRQFSRVFWTATRQCTLPCTDKRSRPANICSLSDTVYQALH